MLADCPGANSLELIYDWPRERRAGAQEHAHDPPTIEMALRGLETTNRGHEWRSARRVRRANLSTCIEEECDHIDAGITNATGCILQRRPS